MREYLYSAFRGASIGRHRKRVAIVMLCIALHGVSCAYFLGLTTRRDMTKRDPKWHGYFTLNAVYELRHGAYLFGDADKKTYSIRPPTRYGVEASRDALVKHGDVRSAPPDFASLEAEQQKMARGGKVLQPVESLRVDSPLPPGLITTLPAGTRIQFVRLIEEYKGDNDTSLFYARVLGREDLGDRVLFTELTNYGGRGYRGTRPYSNQGPNPLMLAKVGDDPTTLPSAAGAGD